MTSHPNTNINWPALPEHDVEEWSESGITLRYVGWSEEKVLAYAESFCTEQATEIAELKAKLAEVMPLARFACDVLRDEDHPDNLAHDYDFLTFDGNEYVLKATIEATIETILKD